MTILAEIEQFLVETGMSPYRFGKLSKGNTALVFHLRAGRGIQPKTVAAIRAFMAAEHANPSPKVTRGPRALACACGAPVSRKADRCRSCANSSAMAKLQRPMPDDFRDVAPGRTVNQLQKIYGCGPEAVKRWREEAGIAACVTGPTGKAPRAIPDSFALVARGMTMKQLRERFSASETLVRRWCAEAGVEPRRAGYAHFRQPGPRPLPDARDQSRAGMAAQFLQKFGSVVRCDAEGRVDPRGTHWLRGGRFVLTDEEIMDRARRNGWDPDAWMEIAA